MLADADHAALQAEVDGGHIWTSLDDHSPISSYYRRRRASTRCRRRRSMGYALQAEVDGGHMIIRALWCEPSLKSSRRRGRGRRRDDCGREAHGVAGERKGGLPRRRVNPTQVCLTCRV